MLLRTALFLLVAVTSKANYVGTDIRGTPRSLEEDPVDEAPPADNPNTKDSVITSVCRYNADGTRVCTPINGTSTTGTQGVNNPPAPGPTGGFNNGLPETGSPPCVEGTRIYNGSHGGWITIRCPRTCSGCVGVPVHRGTGANCEQKCIVPNDLGKNGDWECGYCGNQGSNQGGTARPPPATGTLGVVGTTGGGTTGGGATGSGGTTGGSGGGTTGGTGGAPAGTGTLGVAGSGQQQGPTSGFTFPETNSPACEEGGMRIYNGSKGGWIPIRCPRSCTGCVGVRVHSMSGNQCTDRCITPRDLNNNNFKCGMCPAGTPTTPAGSTWGQGVRGSGNSKDNPTTFSAKEEVSGASQGTLVVAAAGVLMAVFYDLIFF